MTGSLRNAWVYTPTDLWEPLAAHGSAPPDLFGDLFAEVNDFLAVPAEGSEFDEIRNDPAKASTSFLALKGTDFASESAIVEFLEASQDVIADYDLPGYEDLFIRLVRDFLRKHNLRYRLEDPFRVCFLLPGSFSNLYSDLQRVNTGNPHLRQLWQDYERSFDQYSRTCQEHDLKACIANASKYAEGLAGITCGSHGSLGDLCRQIKDWPHAAIRESLGRLYGFCSDYPGIRHAGNPASQLRNLQTRDSVLISVLLVAFSGYLSPRVDERAVLGV